MEEPPKFTREQTVVKFRELVDWQVRRLEKLQKRPPGKQTPRNIAYIKSAIDNCYAALYYLSTIQDKVVEDDNQEIQDSLLIPLRK